MPHEGGFKAIKFSNDYQVENLLCATLGEDNIIKMWSLEDSDNIYKQGKSWYCIAQASYKDLPVYSISFSQDGSLLSAGYGNTLCIFKSDNLKLKAALTGPNGVDGCVKKAQIIVPSKNISIAKPKLAEKRKKLMQLLTNMLETREESLINELQNTLSEKSSLNNVEALDQLFDDAQKASLYKRIIQMHELNLFQKVLLYQKLGIPCKSHPQLKAKLTEYLTKLISKRGEENKLHMLTHRLNLRQRFKAKYRLQQYNKERRQYEEITRNLVSVLSLMNLGTDVENNKKQKNDFYTNKNENQIRKENILLPKPTMAEISHVQFAAGDYAHLVVVCTERRVLIWNLLTLRLHAFLKLSVKHITFYQQTNLMAVVTTNQECKFYKYY